MANTDPVEPRQDYPDKVPDLRTSSPAYSGGRSGGTTVIIGVVMLVAGIALSAMGARIMIGLIVVGIINIVRGLSAS